MVKKGRCWWVTEDCLVEEPTKISITIKGDTIKADMCIVHTLSGLKKNAHKFAVYFQYGREHNIECETCDYRVVAKAKHSDYNNSMLYLIQGYDGKCYLIEEKGIMKSVK